jgi:hypothetical protein
MKSKIKGFNIQILCYIKLMKIFFKTCTLMGEALFHVSDHVNRYNCQIWRAEQSHEVV